MSSTNQLCRPAVSQDHGPVPVARRKLTPTFLVTVDAECDDAWARSSNFITRNAEYLPRFQDICESYGLRPTYFANFEMATSPVFREFGRTVLRRAAGEIGMHLHAWNSPPIVPLTRDDNSYHPYLTEYTAPIMQEKINYMTDLLEDTFGVKMTSHRAGRWGLNEVYASILAERGYTVDCSVTPLTSWAEHLGDPDQHGGPNYTNFPLFPYFMDLSDISRPGNSSLLEIPVTAMELRSPKLRTISSRLRKGSVATRVLNRVFPPRCLLVPAEHSSRLLRKAARKSVALRPPCVQFALHSSNLMPNGSPLYRTERDVEKLYSELHKLFSFAKEKMRGATVTEFRREFQEAHSDHAA